MRPHERLKNLMPEEHRMWLIKQNSKKARGTKAGLFTVLVIIKGMVDSAGERRNRIGTLLVHA
jgi:hypothetical protein